MITKGGGGGEEGVKILLILASITSQIISPLRPWEPQKVYIFFRKSIDFSKHPLSLKKHTELETTELRERIQIVSNRIFKFFANVFHFLTQFFVLLAAGVAVSAH